ncbi:MAG TPA: leucyl aminopeptidase [Beijerinckiaceae bacterium]|nr:leucyl aminopeptidase [Beijerinckiaceae bacterium]
MADSVKIDVQGFGPAKGGDLVVFVGDDLKLADTAASRVGSAGDLIGRLAPLERFKGKAQSALSIPMPQGLPVERLIVVGIGGEKDRKDLDWAALGGAVGARVAGRQATVLLDIPGVPPSVDGVADAVLGARLRAYRFERYKTKAKDGENEEGATRLTFMVPDPAAARRAVKARDAVAAGVVIARDLVNEPPNVLSPEEFARRAQALAKVGVEVEVLDEKALSKLGMRALLAVGQGSARDSRVVVMRWNGGKDRAAPAAFVGKGVVFDSGGISIKPGGGMEDMKGDMAGAACVVGLMHALAARKAKVNAIGIIGLVENMPDGAAQRPGDIVTSMSGQTIEIINTDAEGRLVLADLLWHVQERYKPKFMIDLATLTGAIMVALGQEHAGLFSNDDELAQRLSAAGEATGEKVWRMPLGPAYDKLIDSKFADMKNTGGRHGGSITAAQFLQRFVNETPWAHLDIAGTAMGSPQNEINKSWASGWGVRLLDRLVQDHYER